MPNVKCLVYYATVVFLFQLFVISESLKPGPGVCLRVPPKNRGNRPQKKTYKCCPGYEFANNQCKPECKLGCGKDMFCSQPDTCSCKPPLKLNPTTKTCVEITCNPTCTNGVCIDFNICLCKPGFFNVNETYCAENCTLGYDNDPISYKCEPYCNPSCVNGMCTKPDECTCNDGYQKTGTGNECAPICDPPCENGSCTKPNQCTCNAGYQKNGTSNECTPVCDPPCLNGMCIKPNQCTCNDGYQKTGTANECTPVCDPPCLNGMCTKPNRCTCNDGNQKIGTSNECTPVCDPPCLNGMCIKPNQCTCNDGYQKTGTSNECTPICDPSCINGLCMKPNECHCNEGYRLVDKECRQICDPFCANVPCDSPYNCTCFSGYESTGSSDMCKPKSANCDHGDCVGPNLCQCHEGYSRVHGLCLPVCVIQCVNAICSHPDICECFEGYAKNYTQENQCYKPCNTSCISGRCDLDGVCVCDDGSQLINGSCLAINAVSCNSCVSKCSDGGCFCSNGNPCAQSEEMESVLRRSAFAYTWLAGAIVGVLLLILVGIVMMKLWQKSQRIEEKTGNAGSFQESVVYTLPETLMNRSFHPDDYIEEESEEQERSAETDHNEGRNEASQKLMKKTRNLDHELDID